MTFGNVKTERIPIQIRAMIDEAVELGVVSPSDIVVLALNHGMDWNEWIRAILDRAKPQPEPERKSYRVKLAQERFSKLVEHARSYWDVYPSQ